MLRERDAGTASRTSIAVVTIGVASCVLAYSGIESVLQTAGLVASWRDIAKAYWFLALTVGIVTPGDLGARALRAHRPPRCTRAT